MTPLYRIAILFWLLLFPVSGVHADTVENGKAPKSYPVYGNWCGPDHPLDPARAPAPVDGVDAICMQHDLCYEDKGYLDCECDAVLVRDLKRGIDRKDYDRVQMLYARNIHNYFQASPCDGDPKNKLAPSRILHRVYSKAKEKATQIYDLINGDSTVRTDQDADQESVEAVEAAPKID